METDGIPQLQTANVRSLRQEVAAILAQAICLGYIAPGQRLTEADLAERMNVGRVPVREAISQLEQQGLVTTLPNKGARCIDPSWEDFLEAFALRVNLETLAARLAAVRQDTDKLREMADSLRQFTYLCDDPTVADQDLWQRWRVEEMAFHAKLFDASGSRTLARMWGIVGPFLWATMQYGRRRRSGQVHAEPSVRKRTRKQMESHLALLGAIRTGDMDIAEQAMRAHHTDLFLLAEMDAKVLQALRWPSALAAIANLQSPIANLQS